MKIEKLLKGLGITKSEFLVALLQVRKEKVEKAWQRKDGSWWHKNPQTGKVEPYKKKGNKGRPSRQELDEHAADMMDKLFKPKQSPFSSKDFKDAMDAEFDREEKAKKKKKKKTSKKLPSEISSRLNRLDAGGVKELLGRLGEKIPKGKSAKLHLLDTQESLFGKNPKAFVDALQPHFPGKIKLPKKK